MDRSSAVRQLPDVHAVAIRLRDDGHGDHVIAVALDIEDADVSTLLHIADSKLTNLMALDPISDTSERSHGSLTNKTSHSSRRNEEESS